VVVNNIYLTNKRPQKAEESKNNHDCRYLKKNRKDLSIIQTGCLWIVTTSFS